MALRPDETTAHCIVKQLRFPEFWLGSPAVWLLPDFLAGFYLRNIISRQDKYAVTVTMLPSALQCVVPPPRSQAYDRIRDFVLALRQLAVPRH